LASETAAKLSAEHDTLVRAIYEAWPIASAQVQSEALAVTQQKKIWGGVLERETVVPEPYDGDGQPRLEPVEAAKARMSAPLNELLTASQTLATHLRAELDLI
jgi:hypothetical protein